MVIGKNDGLPEFLTVVDLEPFIHQGFEDAITRAFVVHGTEYFVVPDFRVGHV